LREKIGILGCGYVGWPLAKAFSSFFEVVAFDISEQQIATRRKEDIVNVLLTSEPSDLSPCTVFIVTVPTPIDESLNPDLSALIAASETIHNNLNKGDCVIYESTVFPGCTREICLPILNKSKLKPGLDYHLAYSPERINPGDELHSLKTVTKIVSGYDEDSLRRAAELYRLIITAPVYEVQSIEIAEAAKVIENAQRDVNIAFVNELCVIFDKLNLSTHEVLDAAATKWNFLHFKPGLVGGHCIGVDPYYLTYKSEQVGYTPQVILSGRNINEYIPQFINDKIISIQAPKPGINLLYLGLTFKEDVTDTRNSKSIDLCELLIQAGYNIDIQDPMLSNELCPSNLKEYFVNELPEKKYDLIVLAVGHRSYIDAGISYFERVLTEDGYFIDIKALFRRSWIRANYYSL